MAEAEVPAAIVRAVGLFAPVATVALLYAWRAPSRPLAAGALLATLWNLPALLMLHLVADAAGWWRFEAVGGLAAGFPVDLLLGWMLLWGAAPVLLFTRGPVLAPLLALLLVDLALMPLAEPVVVLGSGWLWGEALGLTIGAGPSLLLGRWTAQGRRLSSRATLQMVLAGALLLWVLPLLVLDDKAGVLGVLQGLPAPAAIAAAVALILVMLPGVAAVQEFAGRGGGTPLPYDPPLRLVRSGPYRYVANPMQSSVTLLLAVLALASADMRLAAGAAVAVAYGAGLAHWHEGEELAARHGQAWRDYRAAVRDWWPRWRPASIGATGTLWVAFDCAQCAPVAAFFAARRPAELSVLPAAEHPRGGLRRVTYEADGGGDWQGIAAIARGLEHLHLGWAMLGWAIRLPGVAWFLQLLVDASGGGPRDVTRSADNGGGQGACTLDAAVAPGPEGGHDG